MGTSTASYGAKVDGSDVTYQAQAIDRATGEVSQLAEYEQISTGDPVVYVNPANAVDGAVAANGFFALHEGDPADYQPVVAEAA